VFEGIESKVINAAISRDHGQIRATSTRGNLVEREDVFADFSGTCIAHVGGGTQVG
jgi:hypothetical protein